jgi:hypothetical protein
MPMSVTSGGHQDAGSRVDCGCWADERARNRRG